MIKIQNSNLDKIAENHYKAIENYIKKPNTMYSLDILDNFVKEHIHNEWNFKKLVLAKPHEMEKLLKLDINNIQSKTLTYFDTLYDYLNNYKEEKFYLTDKNSDKTLYRAYELIQSLNLTVCPYCNRNTIYNIINKKKRTSELDHFYPKRKYPFFAISFYNLIPSCKVCNKLKLDENEKSLINPYDDRFEFNKNMKFNIKIKDVSFYYSYNGFEINKIFNNITNDEKQRIENSFDVFELEDLYQNHKDIVLEIIQKAEMYNDSYIDELLKNYEGTLFKNREDLLRQLFGGYISDEDIGKRPLSKLTKDILEQLEII